MADRTPRIAPAASNLAIASTTVITASSQETALPVAFVRDPQPTKVCRFRLGWNIVTGFNASIDFNRGGVKVATIAAGNYATGALLAVAIVTAMTAADGATTWTCTYDSVTKKFTIGGSANFILLFATGANIATGAGKDLGFAVADTANAVSQVAGLAAYHSREFILFDLASALPVSLGIAHKHNLGSTGTITLYGKASSNPWVTPGTTQVLTGDDLTNKRILFFGSQSYRYWALVFDDVQNTAGYNELGVPFIGTYWEPARGYQIGASRQAEGLTQFARADQGAMYVLARAAPKMHGVAWQGLSRTDRDLYQAIEDAHLHVFLARDPQNYPGTETVYGVLVSNAQVTEMAGPGNLFIIDATVAENLG
jgi:hypothetical protein